MDLNKIISEPINELTKRLKKVEQENIKWFNSDQNEL